MRHPEPLNPYALDTWTHSAQGGHDGEADAVGTPNTTPGRTDEPRPPASEGDEIIADPTATAEQFARPEEYGRRALNTARAAAKKHGYAPRTRITARRTDPRDRSDRAPGYSGARPDPRDPQPLSAVLERVIGELGWDDGMGVGLVCAEWEEIVGPAIAEHCEIVSIEQGLLTVSADSSAWAAQLRMLRTQLITTINERVSRNVIEDVRVTGPQAARWTKGPRTVKWRGPRDTYG